MQDLVDQKDLKIISLEQKWNDLEQHYKNEIQSKNNKTKEMSNELAQKSAALAQLTNQVRFFLFLSFDSLFILFLQN